MKAAHLPGALALVAALACAGAAAAQNYGHERRVWTPDHLFAPSTGAGSGFVTGYSHGYAGVGSPLAEVEVRSYARTGRYATGYSYGYPHDYSYGYAYGAYGYPNSHAYGYAHGYNRYGYDRDHDRRRYVRRDERRPGYHDRYGYHDDRPPVYGQRPDQERRCYCETVYRD